MSACATHSMKVYCCQLDIVWEDKVANCARVEALMRATAPPRGSLVLLPEMFATGFSMNVASIAEGEFSATEQFLTVLARELGVFVVGGVVRSGPDGLGRNQAVVCSPDGLVSGRYTKLRSFTPAGEHERYRAGDELTVFDWEGLRVAPFVCYDLRFPELFRAAVERGAEMLLVIANWPAARADHWTTLLRARAIENQCYVAGVNRCGCDPQQPYAGKSLILGPRGETLAEAGQAESVIEATVLPQAVQTWRAEFPAIRDMRGPGKP